MILVGGESLIDLIVDADGGILAKAGGGPFNVARTVARLGHRARFLGRTSSDPFGRLLAGKLADDGVEVALPVPVDLPTTLAVVDLTERAAPRYFFHLEATSGFALDPGAALGALTTDVRAVHLGSLGLVMEPMATSLGALAGALDAHVLVMVDPNCRPGAVADAASYRGRLTASLHRADIVKVSAEDLDFLVPGVSHEQASCELLERGAACVLVTDGPGSVEVFGARFAFVVPVPAVEVVDTVGAGDAFGGAFLAWWVAEGLGRPALADEARVRAGVESAVDVASLTCTRAGAEPPWRSELAGHLRWAALGAVGPAAGGGPPRAGGDAGVDYARVASGKPGVARTVPS